MNDYVTQVEGTTQAGINELNNLITQKEKAYNDNHTTKMKELTDKGNQYTSDLTDQRNYIDSKCTDFQNAVKVSGLVTTGASNNWQKYKLTNDSGQRTYIKKGVITDITTLNAGFYETVTTENPVAQGFPEAINNSFAEVNVYTTDNSGRKQFVVSKSYDGRTFTRFIHTDASKDTGWLEVPLVADVSTLETTTGSQNKANTAESNAKTYTDTKVKSLTTVLFEGNANGVGTPINLAETLDNFIVLYIFGDFPGGEFASLANPQGTRNINLNLDNIVGLDATGTSTYECSLSKVNRQQLQINSDNSMNVIDGTSSGANANKFTIQKIIGVRK